MIEASNRGNNNNNKKTSEIFLLTIMNSTSLNIK